MLRHSFTALVLAICISPKTPERMALWCAQSGLPVVYADVQVGRILDAAIDQRGVNWIPAVGCTLPGLSDVSDRVSPEQSLPPKWPVLFVAMSLCQQGKPMSCILG